MKKPKTKQPATTMVTSLRLPTEFVRGLDAFAAASKRSRVQALLWLAQPALDAALAAKAVG